MNYTMNEIGGVIPAVMTCFDENGKFDEVRQRTLIRFLLDKKVNGLYLTGSTGEAFLMTPEERKQVVEVVVDEVRGQLPIIVHVGAIATNISIELAQHAFDMGADAISSVPPFYWKFSKKEIIGYYRDISESVPLPMIVYNIALAGLVDLNTIKEIASLKNVKGIKYTATSHFEILRMKEEIGKDFKIFSGCDEMALSGLTFGADGLIGSFYNIIPELFIQIFEAATNNEMDTAKKLQIQADKIIFFILEYPFFASMKMLLNWSGYDVGYCRKPFASFERGLETSFRNGLRKIRDSYEIKDVKVIENI